MTQKAPVSLAFSVSAPFGLNTRADWNIILTYVKNFFGSVFNQCHFIIYSKFTKICRDWQTKCFPGKCTVLSRRTSAWIYCSWRNAKPINVQDVLPYYHPPWLHILRRITCGDSRLSKCHPKSINHINVCVCQLFVLSVTEEENFRTKWLEKSSRSRYRISEMAVRPLYCSPRKRIDLPISFQTNMTKHERNTLALRRVCPAHLSNWC